MLSVSYSFLSSDLGLIASGFLKIPPHDGHPCAWITVPSASLVRTHRQVIEHAERTGKIAVAVHNSRNGYFYYIGLGEKI